MGSGNSFEYMEGDIDTKITSLGNARIDSPVKGTMFVEDTERALINSSFAFLEQCRLNQRYPATLEIAGPRKKIFFDPSKTKAGIVTCGGLCPGINNVIRSIVMEFYYMYGVKNICGIPFGLQGFIPSYAHPLIDLTPELVEHIHEQGGTVLGSSRGGQDISEIVDAIERLNLNVLFFIGGDGTLKAASAVAKETIARNYKCAVIGIPKTIDNDINFVSKTFGFDTAVKEAKKAIMCAHAEAKGAPNGIGLVKFMGRDSGFITAFAALAQGDANFVLVPEIDFDLDGDKGFLSCLEKRIKERDHAVIVVAEGAGLKFFDSAKAKKDASGNIKMGDIGIFMKDAIQKFFSERNIQINLKYIDPSYMIRSVEADATDSIFCGLLAQMAVHAGMSGKTDMLIGMWGNDYVHIPIALSVGERKKIDIGGPLWMSVMESTGQPVMKN